MGITHWAKGASTLPKVKSLPPTVEAFRENVKMAHFQACIWKAALQQYPPELDPIEFGWASKGPSGAYCPVSLPSKVEVSTSDILLKVDQLQLHQCQAMLLAKMQLFIYAVGLLTVLQV